LPLFSTFLVSMLSENNNSYTIKLVSLISSCFIFLCSLGLIIFFDNLVILFQYSFFLTGIFSNNIYFGVDGISLFFITLVTFITLLCILIACRRKIGVKFLLIYIFLIEFFCLIIFTVLDILFFYIFFESVLMPMFAIIGI